MCRKTAKKIWNEEDFRGLLRGELMPIQPAHKQLVACVIPWVIPSGQLPDDLVPKSK